MVIGEQEFQELLARIKALSRDQQVRLFEALGLQAAGAPDTGRPEPAAGSGYHCGRCGKLLSPQALPEECPGCGASRDQFVLEAED